MYKLIVYVVYFCLFVFIFGGTLLAVFVGSQRLFDKLVKKRAERILSARNEALEDREFVKNVLTSVSTEDLLSELSSRNLSELNK